MSEITPHFVLKKKKKVIQKKFNRSDFAKIAVFSYPPIFYSFDPLLCFSFVIYLFIYLIIFCGMAFIYRYGAQVPRPCLSLLS